MLCVLIVILLLALGRIVLSIWLLVNLANVLSQECHETYDEGYEPTVYENMTSIAMSTFCKSNCTCYIDPKRFNDSKYFVTNDISYTNNFDAANGNTGDF